MNIDERLCPLCSEVISLNAVKCKHCQSLLSSGIVAKDEKLCPLCAEIIKVTAIKCKHCRSDLTQNSLMELAVSVDIPKEQVGAERLKSYTIPGEAKSDYSVARSYESISQGYVVLLLLTPFIATVISLLIWLFPILYAPEYAKNVSVSLSDAIAYRYSAPISLFFVFFSFVKDIQALERAGILIRGWSRASILIPPVYLYIRGSKLNQVYQIGWMRSQAAFITWFIFLGISIYFDSWLITYLEGDLK